MKKKHLPFGRIQEYLATLTEEQRQRTATKSGRAIFDDFTVQTWANRKAMAVAIRTQQRNGTTPEWRPVVKLKDGEGY